MKKKKSNAIAILGMASMLMAGHSAKAVEIVKPGNVQNVKEVAVKQERKKITRQNRYSLDPHLPMLNEIGEVKFTSPFFNPSRSMRVKNKLRRKWYK